MKTFPRLAATTFAITVGLGLAGAGLATEAQAHPGPMPQWCPGDYWDPGWGDNWDGWHCHDNWRGPYGDPYRGPDPYRDHDPYRGPDRYDPPGPGGPGWDHR